MSVCTVSSQTIDAFAGTHMQSGYSGDGGPATQAKLWLPNSICSDTKGNVYISDFNNNVIRKVSTDGIITTFAGNGVAGSSGDGGAATSAQLNGPMAVTADFNDNIYILDSRNYVIRRVDPSGVITRFAGNGTSGNTGDGGPALSAQIDDFGISTICSDLIGNIYICHPSLAIVRKISTTGIITRFAGTGTPGNTGDGGPATSAQLERPMGITADNKGNVYISTAPSIIRKVDPSGIITRFAGTGASGPGGDGGPATLATFGATSPMGLASDPCGNIYVADTYNDVVRKIDASGMITSIAGFYIRAAHGNGGPATSAAVSLPMSVAVDFKGNVFILDAQNHTVRKVTPEFLIFITPKSVAVCEGIDAAFTVVIDYITGYQWQINTGAGWINLADNAGYQGTTTSKLYVIAPNLAMNNYRYRCILRRNCTMTETNESTLTVNPKTGNAVSIAASATTVCKGTNVTFTATVNSMFAGGKYLWKKNGNTTGTNSNTYADATLLEGDIISCIYSSPAAACSPDANSNEITMHLFSSPTLTLDKNSGICEGDTRELDAGNFTSYKWHDGSTGKTFVVRNKGKYYVSVLDANGCSFSDTVNITVMHTLPQNFLPADTAICIGTPVNISPKNSYSEYLWGDNSRSESISIADAGTYSLKVTDQFKCIGTDEIVVKPGQCPRPAQFAVPNAFSPNADGKNDKFRPNISGNIKYYRFIIYNRYGQIIFYTSNPALGWDGYLNGKRQPTGMFVWSCEYQFDDDDKKIAKGTVFLLR